MKSRIFCFDLETTGLGNMGRLVVPFQIAGIVLDPNHPGLPQIGEFQSFIQLPAYAVCEDYAMEMHAKKGRTREWMQANGKPPHEVYRALDAFLRQFLTGPKDRLQPAGHNAAGFDLPMLTRETQIHLGEDYKLPLDYHVLDTMIEALWFKKIHGAPSRLNLDAVTAHWGVLLTKDAAHDALNDVRATAEVLRRQWIGRGGQ